MEFSVLMSVYYKEKPMYLKESLYSLSNQTLVPNEIVIVKDGKLTEELDKVIDTFKSRFNGDVKIIQLEKNVGLGLALRQGLQECTYDIVARQDSDDISTKNRFKIEIPEILKGYDLIGTQIHEFIDNIDNVVSDRIVPLNEKDIIKFQKRRCAFNHMTVVFRKSKVLEAGNYENAPYEEDDLLWTRMILCGAKLKNINNFLVYARVGKDLYKRRGGWKYFSSYKNARKKIHRLGFTNYIQYISNITIQFIVCLMPNFLRRYMYVHFLRK